MKTKTFDCVEMMHRGALRIHETLKGKTKEEQLAYWRERQTLTIPNHSELDTGTLRAIIPASRSLRRHGRASAEFLPLMLRLRRRLPGWQAA